MPTLSSYITDVRDIVLDPNSNFFSNDQITRWINKGRSKTAQLGQCVRYMPAATASILSFNVVTPGTGYSTAAATISGPDAVDGGGFAPVQATATVQVSAGQVVGLTVTNPGRGYVVPPTVTISGNGAGATATANLSPHITTIAGQELVPFSDFNDVIRGTVPGLGDIVGIQSISVSRGNTRPMLQHLDFSYMQAMLRGSSIGMQNYPQAWAQYGQGQLGSLYFWPVPAQVSQVEADCYCDVQELSVSQTVDLIPESFAMAPPFYAAYLAMLNAQRFADASAHLSTFGNRILEARVASSPPLIPTMYS